MTTITPEQYRDFRLELERNSPEGALRDVLGITIAPPAPPEKMVSLAEQIAYDAGEYLLPRDYTLAALQHVEKIVRDADSPATCDGKPLIMRTNILTAIGSNRHD